MRCAQEDLLRWAYEDRERRARQARSRKLKVFTPGTLVYYFRRPKGSGYRGGGRFYGPARILATETKHNEGEAYPRGKVWLTSGGRLIRCDPCQLRDASEREVTEHEVGHQAEIPWTFTKIVGECIPGEYDDVGDQIPKDSEFEDALELPTTKRSRGEQHRSRPSSDAERQEANIPPGLPALHIDTPRGERRGEPEKQESS